MGFWGYWSVVAQRAWREAIKDASGGVVSFAKAILAPFIGAVVGLGLTGLLDNPWPKVASVFAGSLLFTALFFVSRMLTIPPAMHREGLDERQQLNDQMSALKSTPSPPNVKAISGLLARIATKCLDMRSKRGASPSQQKAWCIQFVADIETIFGPETVLGLKRKFPQLRGEYADTAMMDGGMIALEAAVRAIQKDLTADKVSTEAADLNGYVSQRLSELRAEQG